MLLGLLGDTKPLDLGRSGSGRVQTLPGTGQVKMLGLGTNIRTRRPAGGRVISSKVRRPQQPRFRLAAEAKEKEEEKVREGGKRDLRLFQLR